MKKRCLFVYPLKAPFVINDGKFLHRHFDVIEYHFKLEKSPFKLGWNLIKFCLFVALHIPRVDFVYTWFTDYHSPILTIWAGLYKKAIYRVVGGYEVEHLPYLKYGGLKNPIRRFAIKYSLNHATELLAVSKHTFQKTKNIVLHNRIKVIYNGIDLNDFSFDKTFNKKDKKYFMTVGNFKTEQYIRRKGIDKFIKLARYLNNETFVIIGISYNLKSPTLKNLPNNIILKPFLSLNELQEYYEKAKYYLQLSELETFGVAVLEAISFGAIPIISNKGALPEIFGDCSIIVDTDRFDEEIKTLKTRIDNFSMDKDKIQKVVSKYDIQNRYNELAKILF
jgi:glycosyltransferase involved in cell wall biosynthesis